MSTYFAEQELAHYVFQMTKQLPKVVFSLVSCDNEFLSPLFDDAYWIDIHQGRGEIKGINERSLLLGTYYALEQWGISFLKPGKANEIIPNISIHQCTLVYHGKPSKRHRIMCIEGSNSLENVLDMIDFIPKIQMNGYFIQFKEPYEFFDRWYSRKNHPTAQGIKLSHSDVSVMQKKIVQEIKKRNLVYHAVGHGWTSEVLGYNPYGWHQEDPKNINHERHEWIAQIKGKRELFNGIPMNTQLCYSNVDVQQIFSDYVVNYAELHPEIDVLHVWLADDFNNFCECESCRKEKPSTFYIRILNLIDKKLSAKNIPTKIMFLLYYELLWPSTTEKIINMSRFIMMFAPITRTYTTSFRDYDLSNLESTMPEFVLNQSKFPSDLVSNLKYLKAWQHHFKGDTVLFDYHLMWDGFKELTHLDLSKVIYHDIMMLDRLNIDGMISCQLQRQFFPHGFAVSVLGHSLTYSHFNVETFEKKYFVMMYGTHASYVLDTLHHIKEFSSHAYLRRETPMIDIDLSKQFALGAIYVKNASIELKERATVDLDYSKDMELFTFYLNFIHRYFELLSMKASGMHKDVIEAHTQSFINDFMAYEDRFQSEFDGYYAAFLVKELMQNEW
jgi:hypothetical protein